jgi:methionine-rich copper-binding protein CopC
LSIHTLVCVCALLVSGVLVRADFAHAHAIVLKSSLATHPIKRDVPGTITLQFNSRIEVKLSRALLVSQDRSEQKLMLSAGDAPGMVIVGLPPLAPGDYAVRYRVLAADGHVTEETLRFSVAP